MKHDVAANAHRAASQLLRLLSKCENSLGPELFGDPALKMLLDLFVTEGSGKKINISALCFASGVPATTALRYVERLERSDLVLRRTNPIDRRSVLLELTPRARESLLSLLGEK